jgi:hypothetical protein
VRRRTHSHKAAGEKSSSGKIPEAAVNDKPSKNWIIRIFAKNSHLCNMIDFDIIFFFEF